MGTGVIRVVVAKPGLDGHDRGAKVVARALRDAGMEVIYTWLRRSPVAIVQTVIQEGADVLFIGGGNIPKRDHEALRDLGVAHVFPTGSDLDEIVDYIRTRGAA